jgi:hypothetical protein
MLGGLIAIALGSIMWLQIRPNPKVDQVIVWDMRHADAPMIRTINSAEELKTFLAIWSNREKLPPETSMQVRYRLALLSGGQGDSWLYDPAGLTRVLSKARTPVYRLPSPELFNRLIGADQGPLAAQ